jgi:hypothetical protein
MWNPIVRLFILCVFLAVCNAAFTVEKQVPVAEKDKAKNFCTVCHEEYPGINKTIDAKNKEDMVSYVTGINQRIESIDRHINYLVNKNADVEYLQNRHKKARQLFHQFVHVFSREDMESTKSVLDAEFTSLDADAGSKVTLARRLDILYITTFIFSLLIITGILIYAIIMYAKRKEDSRK